jgi:hypothetical protein
LAVSAVVILLHWGWDYYLLPRAQRPTHVYHNLLRASGRSGLIFGIAATILFVLNLAYLVRKKYVQVRWMGTLRTWMDCHTVTGLVGGALIFFHAAFAPYSPLGILALAALVITVLTGIVGRYIYSKVPRSLEGRELELEQVRDRLGAFRSQLEDIGVSTDWLPTQICLEDYSHPKSLLGRFIAIIQGDRQSRRDYRSLRRAVRASAMLRPLSGRILPLAQAFFRHRHWLARYYELRNLLASWRFLHRWLAVVMLAVAAIHIGLAMRYGDLWILGGHT